MRKPFSTSCLSKNALIELVDKLVEARVIEKEIIFLFFRHDEREQLQQISNRLNEIDKLLEQKRLGVKKREALVREYGQLVNKGSRKLERVKALEKEVENATN